jgi:hypothetical protein
VDEGRWNHSQDCWRRLFETIKSFRDYPTGGTQIIKGFRLASRLITHMDSPIWKFEFKNEPANLVACY